MLYQKTDTRSGSGGGLLTWKGGTGMGGPHTSLAIHKTLSWGTSPYTRPSFERKMWSFPFKSKHFCRKYDNFQLQKLKFDCNFCQKDWKFCKISILKPLSFDETPLASPHFHSSLFTHKPPSLEIRATKKFINILAPQGNCRVVWTNL